MFSAKALRSLNTQLGYARPKQENQNWMTMRQERFRGVIWPRQVTKPGPRARDPNPLPAAQGPEGPVYRYVVVGMLVTNQPIQKFEKAGEHVLDGNAWGVLDLLAVVPTARAAYPLGDATSVLLGLESLVAGQDDLDG